MVSRGDDLMFCYFLERLEQIREAEDGVRLPNISHRIHRLLGTMLRSSQSENPEKDVKFSIVKGYNSQQLEKNLVDVDIAQFKRALHSIASVTGPIHIDLSYLLPPSGGEVIKEFAAYSRGAHIAWITLKPPKKSVSHGSYIRENIHEINCDTGISLHLLRKMTSKLFTRERKVYVQGMEKAILLERYFDTWGAKIVLLNLRPDVKPSWKYRSYQPCPLHHQTDSSFSCAMRNVQFNAAVMEESGQRSGKDCGSHSTSSIPDVDHHETLDECLLDGSSGRTWGTTV